MKPTTANTNLPAPTLKKLRTLHQLAEDLHRGKDFSITRLTILKSLCDDPDAAAHFALHLAKKTEQAMRGKKRQTEKSKRYQRLVVSAVRQMTEYLKKPTSQGEEALWALFSEIREQQNRYEHQRGLPDAHAHIAVQQEANAAEHLLLTEASVAGSDLADADSKRLAKLRNRLLEGDGHMVALGQ